MIYTFTGNTAMKKCAQLNEELALLQKKEEMNCKFTYLEGETPIIPIYSSTDTSQRYNKLVENVTRIKTGLASFNKKYKGPLTDKTIEEILVVLPLLNSRKRQLEYMRSISPKSRTTKNNVSEYTVINYDMSTIDELYKKYCDEIVNLQEDINYLNATNRFDVDLVD